ncbi:hypothetical protein halTADL_2239 [Halohasta litchfieldiae]|jgi:hypothetical protein|uniref:Uncharacterized protein n=2 Tax=Halohasta litchfieldiae TaxID=1073996 RepID=A0A1H6VJN3_9EURY|nr:hypothetical protein halTADL_2239 [Halohasta litchfieldiae]SEJ01877.1 hypothetical protein SAMN05444271_11659 [Halohasta litchfieldiae]
MRFGLLAAAAKQSIAVPCYVDTMCKYCNYAMTDGWTELLEHDDVYQTAMADLRGDRSNYGFSEEFDELREDLAV